jgi:hypothetical protein
MKLFRAIVGTVWLLVWWCMIAMVIMCWCEDGSVREWQPSHFTFYTHLLIAVLTPPFLVWLVWSIDRRISKTVVKAIAQQQQK